MCTEVSPTWWQSVIIGASGGAAVWLLDIARKEFLLWNDKRIIYNWINDKTNNLDGGNYKQRTLRAVAAGTNIPIDRARYVCYKHKKINTSVSTDTEMLEIR